MKVVLIFQIAQKIVHTGLEKRKVKVKQLLYVSQPIEHSVFSKPSKYFNVKTSSKYLLDKGKDLLLLPYTYNPSSSTVGPLLHLQ